MISVVLVRNPFQLNINFRLDLLSSKIMIHKAHIISFTPYHYKYALYFFDIQPFQNY